MLRQTMIWVVAVGLLAGCVTTPRGGGSPIARIEANRPLFESWPIEVREAILDQRVIAGMDAEMVRMALGQPSEITYPEHPRADQVEEVWIYRRSGGSGGPTAVRNTSVTVGAGPGGVYVGGGPSIGVGMGGGGGGAYPDEDRVIFLSGRVIRSTLGP